MAEEKITNIAQNLEIVIDDGSVKVPVKNRHGDQIGEFYFHPTDIGMIGRYNELVEELDKIAEPLEGLNINADGTTDEDDAKAVEVLNEAQNRLFAACDRMFGGNMAEAFFGNMHPFSPVNGMFYCEAALEAVGKIISAQFDDEVKKINKRMSKYTENYPGKRARKGK